MNDLDSKKLIKILFYSDIILNNQNNNTVQTKNNTLNTNIFNQFYNNNKLYISHENIQHIKNLYNLNNNNISDILSYYFINNIFNIPNNKISIDIEYINILNNKISNNKYKIEKNSILTNNDIKNKLSNNINISYDTEKLYNPYNNILGHIIFNNDYKIYDDIIRYTSEQYLLLNEPMLKYNIKSYDVFNSIILNILNNNDDITSYNIKKNIDNYKNIEYNIDTILPFYIINYFKPKNIININNDYGQWLYASNILDINKLITINQYKYDNEMINNINKLTKKKINFKSVDNNYLFNDENIDLIYYNCNFLHEHFNNNFKNILYNEYYYKFNLLWQILNNNGYLLINLYDISNKKIIELINLYIDTFSDSKYLGILCLHKNTNIYPIWIFQKNITNKSTYFINNLFNEYINKL